MYTENDLLFPHALIPSLQFLRGARWQALVQHVMLLPEVHEETLGFMLMMIRLNGCVPCENDSFRAMRGCPACALQTLRRYKGDDEALLALYQAALDEVRAFAAAHPAMHIAASERHSLEAV